MNKVWVLDIGCGVKRAFSTIDKAYDAAYNQLIEWGYDPEDEVEKNFFVKLKSTYENENYSGFSVDKILWCTAIPIE